MKITKINEWYVSALNELESGSSVALPLPDLVDQYGDKVRRSVVIFRLRNGVFRYNQHTGRNISVRDMGDKILFSSNEPKVDVLSKESTAVIRKAVEGVIDQSEYNVVKDEFTEILDKLDDKIELI